MPVAHRVVLWKIPFLAVLVCGHAERCQMTLQGLESLPIIEAN
jgi:hypothetical protein